MPKQHVIVAPLFAYERCGAAINPPALYDAERDM